jgi:hypothetical protein
MFYTLQACAWSMATTVASPAEGGGVSALEEDAMVSASCRVAATPLASKAAVETYSSSRRREMARTWERALVAFFSAA